MDARVSSANVRRSVRQVEVWKADERETLLREPRDEGGLLSSEEAPSV